jgi:dynein heavy chain, axonemal|tara:strand:+ start:331 stop:780 length:450 start_codon:yes stop_codon:yes gene_type:complete
MIRLNSFLASASIMVGKTKGETRLPLPPLNSETPSLENKDLVHALEGAVVTWTEQIKQILDRSHESSLNAQNSSNPTPDEELRFWESQSQNLNAIFSQLKSKRMRNVMVYLDQVKSSYCGPFAALCKNVFTARLESNNNVKFLRTLEKW